MYIMDVSRSHPVLHLPYAFIPHMVYCNYYGIRVIPYLSCIRISCTYTVYTFAQIYVNLVCVDVTLFLYFIIILSFDL